MAPAYDAPSPRTACACRQPSRLRRFEDRHASLVIRISAVRIFWQSFVDQATSAPYMARLAAYLNEIAAPGTSVHVEGITPADRDFGRLSEFRCAIQAVDNGLAAQENGFDAYVMGHFQDPGLYELRSALTIPVVGRGDAARSFATGAAARPRYARWRLRGLALRAGRSLRALRPCGACHRNGLPAGG